MTDIEKLIGKELSMEVGEDITLKITVLDKETVRYQFIGLDGNDEYTEDDPIIRNLEICYDDIDDVDDYSFTDTFGSRFFLFQFE